VTREQLLTMFAEENWQDLLGLIEAATQLHVLRSDFDPDEEPKERASADDWRDYAYAMHELASEIDDALCVAQADVDSVRKLAEQVRRNLSL
jgi:soluble cytochrome b562